jgi:hypothetical protein
MHNIDRGIYQVSLGLAKRQKGYEWVSRTWWQNEIGKLFRSLVISLFTVTWIIREQWFASALSAVCVLIAFCLYWRLKVWHMCGLYTSAKHLVETDGFSPAPCEMTKGE